MNLLELEICCFIVSRVKLCYLLLQNIQDFYSLTYELDCNNFHNNHI